MRISLFGATRYEPPSTSMVRKPHGTMDPPSIGPMLPLLQINLTLRDLIKYWKNIDIELRTTWFFLYIARLDFGIWDEYLDLEVGMRWTWIWVCNIFGIALYRRIFEMRCHLRSPKLHCRCWSLPQVGFLGFTFKEKRLSGGVNLFGQ